MRIIAGRKGKPHFCLYSTKQTVAPFNTTVNAKTEGEKKIANLLTEKLNPTYLEVRDVSGKDNEPEPCLFTCALSCLYV